MKRCNPFPCSTENNAFLCRILVKIEVSNGKAKVCLLLVLDIGIADNSNSSHEPSHS